MLQAEAWPGLRGRRTCLEARPTPSGGGAAAGEDRAWLGPRSVHPSTGRNAAPLACLSVSRMWCVRARVIKRRPASRAAGLPKLRPRLVPWRWRPPARKTRTASRTRALETANFCTNCPQQNLKINTYFISTLVPVVPNKARSLRNKLQGKEDVLLTRVDAAPWLGASGPCAVRVAPLLCPPRSLVFVVWQRLHRGQRPGSALPGGGRALAWAPAPEARPVCPLRSA